MAEGPPFSDSHFVGGHHGLASLKQKWYHGFVLISTRLTGMNIWVFPKIGGKDPKMDGENKGKPY